MRRRSWIAIAFVIFAWAFTTRGISAFLPFKKPGNFPAPVYAFTNNKITEAKFELGRKLFYEPRLSRDNTVSCGSCHIQSAAFTHHGHDVSHGIDDQLGSRNAPPIMNLAWSKTFFWDGGVFNLDLQPLVPITNPVEMDEKLVNVLNKLRTHPEYPALFKKAFGSPEINTERMMKALSQFMTMLVSANSKYDKVKRNEGETFTPDEQRGYLLFQKNCGGCHKEPLFTDESFRNNGIGIGPNKDEGRSKITLNDSDKFKFKVPSLRNLQYTAPYMHDGRFLTLRAVLEHYSRKVKPGPTLDPLLKQQTTPGIPMTAEEQAAMLAFLKTLNDPGFVTDKRFAEDVNNPYFMK